MEYMGQTQSATYMTGPKLGSATTSQFLPAIGSMQSSYKAFDTYPAPSPLRRSHTTLPWRPSTYYGVAKVNPTVGFLPCLTNPALLFCALHAYNISVYIAQHSGACSLVTLICCL